MHGGGRMSANMVQSGMAAVTNIGSKFKCFLLELRSSGILFSESSGNFLTMFQDNLSVPSSRVDLQGFDPLKMGLIGCPETSVRNYHYSLCNNPEERSSHILCDGSLKSHKNALYFWIKLQ